jgi:5-methylcytosine-specific restriction endonuclease McrA
MIEHNREINKALRRICYESFLGFMLVFAKDRTSAQARYWVDEGFREERKAYSRERYATLTDSEVERVRAYKHEHPDKNVAWNVTRLRREWDLSDGTVTRDTITALKVNASECAYCAKPLDDRDKVTDHMNPLCLGGEHSIRNIVIVCRSCNGRKATLSFTEWLNRLSPDRHDAVAALWVERYGMAIAA